MVAKCQANYRAGKERKRKLCCSAGISIKAISSTTVAHLFSLPHSFSCTSEVKITKVFSLLPDILHQGLPKFPLKAQNNEFFSSSSL